MPRELDVLMLRNDPSADAVDRPWAEGIGVLFGRIAAEQGVLVLNDPDGLSQATNKLYFQSFPRVAPGADPDLQGRRRDQEVRR